MKIFVSEVAVVKKCIWCLVVIGLLTGVAVVDAQVKLNGYFIAREECQAYQSIRKNTNPGEVTVTLNQAYDLLAKNKPAATHYLIRMDAEPPTRLIATGCGEHVVPADGSVVSDNGGNGDIPSQEGYLLAFSRQPRFCETRPNNPECISQTEERYDASHFTLHGLWPQPGSNVYYLVSPEEVNKDKNGHWDELSELTMEEDTGAELDKVMPGTQSFLQRHEWTKHGTCYNGASPEIYFRDSLAVMKELNADNSAIHSLFVDNIGQEITAEQIREAFDFTFGDGTGDKIKISCTRVGARKLITEITIGLKGDLEVLSVNEAMMNADAVSDIGCTAGIVDPVGLQ